MSKPDQRDFGPEKIWPLVAAGMFVLLTLNYFQASNAPTEPVAVLRANNPDGTPGGAVYRRDCNPGDNRIWVSNHDFTECIAYVVARSGRNDGMALVFFNGDVPEPLRRDQAKPEVAARELQRAEAGAPELWITTAALGRPGMVGSTGIRNEGGCWGGCYIMSAAVDSLKQQLGVSRIAMAGQSGGARLIAQMLALGRNETMCAAMGSGAYDLPKRTDGSRAATNLFGNPARRYMVPLLVASEIPVLSGRRLIVIGDREDQRTAFEEQQRWAQRLTELGHDTLLIEARGQGPERHGLSNAAIRAAAACITGGDELEIRNQTARANPI